MFGQVTRRDACCGAACSPFFPHVSRVAVHGFPEALNAVNSMLGLSSLGWNGECRKQIPEACLLQRSPFLRMLGGSQDGVLAG